MKQQMYFVILSVAVLSSCAPASKKFHRRADSRKPLGELSPMPRIPHEIVDEANSEAIGFYSDGCMVDDYQLSQFDGNFELVNAWRNRHWAHGRAVNFIAYFTDTMANKNIGPIKISDVSQHGGGDVSPSHASHQMGLDIDIWLANGNEEYQDVVQGSSVNEELFEKFHARDMYRTAVANSNVQRIFVNPAIKQYLCRTESDTSWLRKLRPMSGHTGHMHVRLYCTDFDEDCIPQFEIGPGSGCNEVLSPDFDPYFFADEMYSLQQKYHHRKNTPSRCHQ